MKLNEIINVVPALQVLQNVKFLPKTSLNFYKLGKQIDKALIQFNDDRDLLFEKNEVSKDLKGATADDIAKLNEDVDQLVQEDIELIDFKVKFSELERALIGSNIDISANMISSLEWLIDYDVSESKFDQDQVEIDN